MKFSAIYKSSVPASAKVLAIATLAIALGACAPSPVKDSDKDTTGAYDGKWTGTINATPAQFRHGNWIIHCYDMAGKVTLSVQKGRVSARWNRGTHSGFINSKGKFRIEIASSFKFKENAANTSDLKKGTKYFIDGSLGGKSAKGRLTHGYGDFGYQGCSSSINYSKG